MRPPERWQGRSRHVRPGRLQQPEAWLARMRALVQVDDRTQAHMPARPQAKTWSREPLHRTLNRAGASLAQVVVTPAQIAVKMPAETLAKMPADTPAKTPVAMPVKMLAHTPVETGPARMPAQGAQPAGTAKCRLSTTTCYRRAGILAPGDQEPVHTSQPTGMPVDRGVSRTPGGETPAEVPDGPPDGGRPAQSLAMQSAYEMRAYLPVQLPAETPDKLHVDTPSQPDAGQHTQPARRCETAVDTPGQKILAIGPGLGRTVGTGIQAPPGPTGQGQEVAVAAARPAAGARAPASKCSNPSW